MFSPDPELYKYLIDSTFLDRNVKADLMYNRGFSEEIIETFKLRNAGPQMEDKIKNLDVPISRKFACALTDEYGRPSWQFTTEGMVIIPYIDNDEIYFLKSHKRGSLRDAGVMPFCELSRSRQGDTLVLCESEFKAIAMYQYGYASLGLSGISTFIGKHFENLLDILRDKPKIVILFDTEIQDVPGLPSYKMNPASRYQHIVYAFMLGKKIELAFRGIGVKNEVKIAILPEEWCVDGKIDCDKALATGRTKEEIDKVIEQAMPPDVFRNFAKVSERDRPLVQKQMERVFKTSQIYVSDNCYYATVVKKKEKRTVRLSNFIVKLLSTIDNEGERIREIKLVSQFGEESEPIIVSPREISNNNLFRELCLSAGDYIWKGTDNHLSALFEELFVFYDQPIIKQINAIGHIEEMKKWFFNNIIITDDGDVAKANKGVIGYDENFYAIKPLEEGMEIIINDEELNLDMIARLFRDAYGLDGYLAFWWYVTSLFSDWIFKYNRSFPFLLITGEAKSGKSTLTELIGYMAGSVKETQPLNIKETTQNAIVRRSDYFHSLPIRLDEIRDDRNIDEKISMLRSLYNRQGASKGVKKDRGVRNIKINSTLVVSGEQPPDDPAFVSRCIHLRMSPSNKNESTAKAVKTLLDMGDKLSSITYTALIKAKKIRKHLAKDLADTSKGLIERFPTADNRQINHYSAILSIHGRLSKNRFNFNEFIKREVEDINDDNLIDNFFRDIHTLLAINSLEDPKIYFMKNSHNRIDIYVSGVYQFWQRNIPYSNKKNLMSRKVIFDCLRNRKCVESIDGRATNIKGVEVNTYVVDMQHPTCPKYIREIYELL